MSFTDKFPEEAARVGGGVKKLRRLKKTAGSLADDFDAGLAAIKRTQHQLSILVPIG